MMMGIIDQSQLDSTPCQQSMFQDPYFCSQYLDQDKIRQAVYKHGAGKTEWDLVGINTAKFRFPTPTAEIEEVCFGEGTLFFLQIGCTYTETQLKERQVYGLLIGCITIGVALFILAYTEYLEQIFSNDFKLFDVNTITAADYTLEIKFPKGFFNRFCELYGSNKSDD